MIHPQYQAVLDGEVLGQHWLLSVLKEDVRKKYGDVNPIYKIQKAANGEWKPIIGQ